MMAAIVSAAMSALGTLPTIPRPRDQQAARRVPPRRGQSDRPAPEMRGGGRVGRSVAGDALAEAITLAVIASIRHLGGRGSGGAGGSL